MSTTQKLIALVERQTSIWDKKTEKYKDKCEKGLAWKAVARGMYENWESFPKKEQNQKMSTLKKKWKNVRDALMKFHRPRDSVKRKKYVHFEALSFLHEYIKRPGDDDSESDGSSQEEDCDSPSLNNDTKPHIDVPPPTSQETIPSCSTASTQTSSHKNSSQPALVQCPFQTSIMKIVDQASSNLAKSARTLEDADRLYLLSLVPDFKNLDIETKWEFRQYVADFFRDAYKT